MEVHFRDNEYPSFKDGNVDIISAENHTFRVYSSILEISSEILGGLVRQEASRTTLNTLITIYLNDSTKHLHEFLAALYFGLYVGSPSSPFFSEALVLSTYSMAFKYHCARLSRRCYSLLTLHCTKARASMFTSQLMSAVPDFNPEVAVNLASSIDDCSFVFHVQAPTNVYSVRVHRELLIKRSPVLREMMEKWRSGNNKAPMGMNLGMEDSGNFEEFIDALYYGFYHEYLNANNVDHYANVLRLANKFHVRELQDTISAQFTTAYPMGLEEALVVDAKRSPRTPRPHPLAAIATAQSCRLPQMLTFAHLELCIATPDQLSRFVCTRGGRAYTLRLTAEHRARVECGRRQLLETIVQFTHYITQTRPRCTSPKVCPQIIEAVVSHVKRWLEAVDAPGTPPVTLFTALQVFREKWESKIQCAPCTLTLRKDLKRLLEHIWNIIPRVFQFNVKDDSRMTHMMEGFSASGVRLPKPFDRVEFGLMF